MDKYDCLKLSNQMCFPLYAISKEIIKRYNPILEELDLTYTQYICMMALWEDNTLNVKSLGERIFLDSGTLTPLLKKLEAKGYIKRVRSKNDERQLDVILTEEGLKLKDKALMVPEKISCCIPLEKEDAESLYRILNKLLNNMCKG